MARLLRRPDSKRRLILTILGGVVGLGVVAFVAAYFLLFPTSSPNRFSLSSSTAARPAAGTAAVATGASATATGTSAQSDAARVAGRWTVASGSEAGYRVREKLGFLPAQSDAVGRTSDTTGQATLRESEGHISVTSASFTVAVNTLKSDKAQRDEKIHTIGLESDRYPTAAFTLTSALELPAGAADGRVVHGTVTGLLTIHGTQRRETIPLETRLSGSTFEAVGSLTFPWSEFNMTAPSIGGFVNVTEKATMEFDLRLAHT